MSKIQEIIDNYLVDDETVMTCDGFDEAIIGITDGGFGSKKLIYDKHKILVKLMQSNMTYEDAIDYYEYNISCCYMGEGTPIFCEVI